MGRLDKSQLCLSSSFPFLTSSACLIVDVSCVLSERGGAREKEKKNVEAFFAPAEKRPAGADRNLANGLEAAERCIKNRNYLKPAVDEWLK